MKRRMHHNSLHALARRAAQYGLSMRQRYDFFELVLAGGWDYEHSKDLLDIVWGDLDKNARLRRRLVAKYGAKPS